jgi:hypothetical protein
MIEEDKEGHDDDERDITYRPESGYGNRMHRARGKRPERIREEVKDDEMRRDETVIRAQLLAWIFSAL